MTDEEMAKGWVIDNTGFNPKEPLGKIAIRTFLAGLRAGKDMAETEKEKCELLGIIQGKDKVIQELEKENAELRNRNSKLAGQKASLERWYGEAKEIIKEMLSILPKENIEGVYEITEEAELFLRENE